MSCDENLDVDKDYEYLVNFLPDGWQEKAKELGALRRCRKFHSADVLLRVLLIHLAEGCSLRETAVRVKQGDLIDISDVAILGRLRDAGDWFNWIATGLMDQWVMQKPEEIYGSRWNIRLVDGTRIKEPGPTGSSWCIHYSIELPSLHCNELHVTNKHGSGESFARFSIKPNDLLIGDRVYGAPPSIRHVAKQGGDVIVRFPVTNLPLQTCRNRKFNLLRHLRTVTGTKVGNWDVKLANGDTPIAGRVCAIKMSRQAAEKAQARVRRAAQKQGRNNVSKQTLEAAKYIFVFTTIPSGKLLPSKVLEIYRGRWQIELAFKRLKSLLHLGHLRKTDPQAAKAWLEGKIMIAFLVEALLRKGEDFSPWGYPLARREGTESMSMARRTIYV